MPQAAFHLKTEIIHQQSTEEEVCLSDNRKHTRKVQGGNYRTGIFLGRDMYLEGSFYVMEREKKLFISGQVKSRELQIPAKCPEVPLLSIYLTATCGIRQALQD